MLIFDFIVVQCGLMSGGREQSNGKLSPKEAAAVIGVTVSTLCIWRQRKIGPPFYQRTTKRVFYLKPDLEAWEASQRVG